MQNIGLVVGVQDCDIARGLYHIQGQPPQVLYFVYQTVLVYYMILHNDGIISVNQLYTVYMYIYIYTQTHKRNDDIIIQ